ncbi:hypothetical protein [Pseudorhodoferax sp.]
MKAIPDSRRPLALVLGAVLAVSGCSHLGLPSGHERTLANPA